MKERTVRLRKILHDMWFDWWRWSVLVFLVYGILSSAIMLYFRFFDAMVYFIGFLISISLSWVLMFFKKEANPHFKEDD